ncbi:diguanylate cyclase [Paenibacillus albicereus]|uniref:Diguanylate cyclase n=1 Tax=Paenibacillus albicereus TaxID=2726185 RepID=A0A6H2GT24_9BACL|nr:diguanylate cyclase [Paenibacillus albicereus]QJC50581.1 diguanylate cyclase [Paenibacillus albicereus]
MLMTASCLVAACVPLALSLLIFRYRQVPGTNFYMLMALLSAFFSFSVLMQYSLPEYDAKLLWRNAAQISIFLFPIASLFLSMIHAGLERWIRPGLIVALSVVSCTALILFFTDTSHHLMRVEVQVSVSGLTVVQRTTLATLFIGYTQLVQLVGASLLLRAAWEESGRRRRQLALMAGGSLLPVLGISMNLIHPQLAGTPAGVILFSLLPACIVIFYGLYRYQLLHIVPFARDKLIESMKEGVVVLDADLRLMDYNPSAYRLLVKAGAEQRSSWTALPLPRLLPGAEAWVQAHEARAEAEIELAFADEHGVGQVWLNLTVTPLESGRGVYYGSLSVIADITETKRLEQDLRRRAATDGLTGIYNRAGFMERAQRHLALSLEEGEPFSLLVLDLDHFKRINDEHGHQCGDMALKRFVRSVQQVVERRALFGRVGGEEFAVALPGSRAEQARELAERIRRAVMDGGAGLEETGLLAEEAGAHAGLTVSIGGSTAGPAAGADFQLMFAAADRALYRAKRGGRNQVRWAEDSD